MRTSWAVLTKALRSRARRLMHRSLALARGDVNRLRSELVLFGRVLERRGRRLARGDGQDDLVEVAGPDERLVLHRLVAQALLQLELTVLQRGVGGHALVAIARRQLEHAQVERVEAGEGDELIAIAHGPQLALEPRDPGSLHHLVPTYHPPAV